MMMTRKAVRSKVSALNATCKLPRVRLKLKILLSFKAYNSQRIKDDQIKEKFKKPRLILINT